ncbi:MAG: type I methionyl aminopeptidase [Acidobacteria bacterium]|nr:type I methionyl aminopeptidase [Acidobacteriota bacterium]
MTIESEHQLDALKRICQIVATILKKMLERVEPGLTTLALDQYGQELFDYYGARSAPRLTYNFPGTTCISINEEAAHGIPGARVIQPGDLVNIDVSGELNGFFGDTGGTVVVPPDTALKRRLVYSTQMALKAAMSQARAGQPIREIGRAIEQTAKKKGFRILRNLCSHGVGLGLHEEPKEILPYYDPRDRRVLTQGMVITIEPFLSTRSTYVSEASDGWTLLGEKGNLSAQFEHTMVITEKEPLILTQAF